LFVSILKLFHQYKARTKQVRGAFAGQRKEGGEGVKEGKEREKNCEGKNVVVKGAKRETRDRAASGQNFPNQLFTVETVVLVTPAATGDRIKNLQPQRSR